MSYRGDDLCLPIGTGPMIDGDTVDRLEHGGSPITSGVQIVLARHAGEENAVTPESPRTRGKQPKLNMVRVSH